MGTWRLIDPEVFLNFFLLLRVRLLFLGGRASYIGGFFFAELPHWVNQLVRTKGFFLDLVWFFCIFCGGFLRSSLFITLFFYRIVPLLAPYKYKGVGLGDTRR